jgi:hypothetical protein
VEYSAPDDNLPIVRLRTNDGKTVRLTRQRDSDKLVVVKGDSNDELQLRSLWEMDNRSKWISELHYCVPALWRSERFRFSPIATVHQATASESYHCPLCQANCHWTPLGEGGTSRPLPFWSRPQSAYSFTEADRRFWQDLKGSRRRADSGCQ